MPTPARGRGEQAFRDNAACVACHTREAAAWARSLHHHANSNAAYRRAFSVEPSPFCQGCHAPEADPKRPAPSRLGDLGVACVTCHVTAQGDVLAAPSRAPGEAPHPVTRSVAFSTAAACAGCHEFRFPLAPGADDEAFMQTTAREHTRLSADGRSCADCHMPPEAGGRSHSFSQVRDPGFLRAALSAKAELLAPGVVRVNLSQREPGHAIPTGDLFRRLEVGAELRDRGRSLGRATRHLARNFAIEQGVNGRALLRDDRVFGDSVEVELHLPEGGPGASVVWWVKLQRVASAGKGTDPSQATIESEVLIHRGSIVTAPSGQP